MTAEPWRCFVSAPIDGDVRTDLERAVAAWRSRSDLAGLRWTDPSSWHVTLAFLGAVSPDELGSMTERLDALADRHPAAAIFETGGLGAFPRREAARVAWYGVHDPAGMMGRLASDIAGTLSIEDERPLRPHVTLARAINGPVDLRAWAAQDGAPTGAILLEEIRLMRSHGGRHQAIASFRLGGPAHE